MRSLHGEIGAKFLNRVLNTGVGICPTFGRSAHDVLPVFAGTTTLGSW